MAETTAWRSHCQFITFITFLFTVNVIRQMAPLFSKVDSNKLWHDVQHEENVISAKFGKDLFNISKVIGRKKVAQFFLTHSVHSLLTLQIPERVRFFWSFLVWIAGYTALHIKVSTV